MVVNNVMINIFFIINSVCKIILKIVLFKIQINVYNVNRDMVLMKIKFVNKYKKQKIVQNKINNNLLNVNYVNKIIILMKIYVSKFKIKFQIVSIMKIKKSV